MTVRQPLEGIRVLDLSRVLVGPFCTMVLGDLGAEIIKVERPGVGDETRTWGPPWINEELKLSAYFVSINRNKKSIAVNLARGEGRKIIYELARISDVVIENFRPGVAKKLGVDYEAMSKVNPRIVYCSVSGFGQTGPYRDWPAYDIIIQAMGGWMGITGEPGRPPVRIGVALTDMIAGLYAAVAILAALRARELTGKGQYIDISLLDASISFMTYMAHNYFATGENPRKMGSAHPNIAPYQAFKAADGKWVILAVANDKLWRLFCQAAGLQHLADDPRFATNAKRVENREQLIPIIEEVIAQKPSHEWVKTLMEAGVPCAPIYQMSDIFSDPHVLHRQMLLEVEHPKAGKVKQIGFPIKLSEMPCAIRLPPPLLGEHTEEVLKELLGYTDEQIARLRAEGVIQ